MLHLSSINVTQCNVLAFVARLLDKGVVKVLRSPIATPMILDWRSERC